MAGSTAKASSTSTKGVAVKRPPSSSPTSTSSMGSKKSGISLVMSIDHITTTPTSWSSGYIPPTSPSSSPQPITLNMPQNTNITNAEATTSPTHPKPNETAILINAYSEISDSFSSLMERLKEVNHARTAHGSLSLSTENRMFLASVEASLMDTMKKRLSDLATSFKTTTTKN